MEDTLTTNIIVTQVPASVEFVCPYCEEPIQASYEKYKDKLRDTDFEYQKIECPMCGKKFGIDSIDWD